MTSSRPADHGYPVGVQSVVFADRSLDDLLDAAERIGSESGLEGLELWGHHLSPTDDEATITAGLDRLEGSPLSVRGYGVVDLESPADVPEHLGFADRLGADYLTVNYPPDADAITEALLEGAETHGIDVAIHNYSTVHHDELDSVFSSIDDVRGVLERYDHPRLGVCVDTGHFLVMDESPADVLADLGDRTVAVHLKDTSEAEREDLPGAGRLDLPRIFDLLEAHVDPAVPVVIEYELPDERAEEALAEALGNLRAARE